MLLDVGYVVGPPIFNDSKLHTLSKLWVLPKEKATGCVARVSEVWEGKKRNGYVLGRHGRLHTKFQLYIVDRFIFSSMRSTSCFQNFPPHSPLACFSTYSSSSKDHYTLLGLDYLKVMCSEVSETFWSCVYRGLH